MLPGLLLRPGLSSSIFRITAPIINSPDSFASTCITSFNVFLRVPAFPLLVNSRTFLSEAYQCDAKWETILSRSQDDDPDDFDTASIRLRTKRNRDEWVTPVEIDALAHKLHHVDDLGSLDAFEPLLRSVRRSPLGGFLHPGTSHAVVRGYLDMNLGFRLADRLLPAKLDYGLFLDAGSAPLLLDDLIVKEDWRRASVVASDLMKQETFFSPLTRRLSAYGVLKHLTGGELDEDENAFEAAEAAAEEALMEEEEVLEYSHYRPNGWTDDHFDLRSPRRLASKALRLIGAEEGGDLGASLVLIGVAMEGGDNAAMRVQELESMDRIVAEWAKEFAEVRLKQLNCEAALSRLEGIKTTPMNLEDTIRSGIESAAAEEADEFVRRYEERLSQWTQERSQAYEKERRDNQEKEVMEMVRRQLEHLERQEEVLTYFENELRIEQLKEASLKKKIESEKPIDRYEAYLRTLDPNLIDLREKTGKTWWPVRNSRSTVGGPDANQRYHYADYYRVPWWSV